VIDIAYTAIDFLNTTIDFQYKTVGIQVSAKIYGSTASRAQF